MPETNESDLKCPYCQRDDITTAGGMTRHKNACKANPAHRASGANSDTVAIRVRKAADEYIAEAREIVFSLTDSGDENGIDYIIGRLAQARNAFVLHDKLAKLLEVD